jgi:lysozyme family protein
MRLTPDLRTEYERLYLSCEVKPGRSTLARKMAGRLSSGRPRYEIVSTLTRVPWWFVGALHAMEASFNWSTHIHNGDPLTARTLHVPANRPASGNPPFAWEASAEDALRYQGLDRWRDWSIAGALFCAESFNGFGYRNRRKPSHYLWGGSFHEQAGRYVADGWWDALAESKQIGVALLWRLLDDVVEFEGSVRCGVASPSDYRCVELPHHDPPHRDEMGLAWD